MFGENGWKPPGKSLGSSDSLIQKVVEVEGQEESPYHLLALLLSLQEVCSIFDLQDEVLVSSESNHQQSGRAIDLLMDLYRESRIPVLSLLGFSKR